MKHVFALLSFALMSSGLAQAPEYVPADGLVAWYPLDGNGTDVSGNDLHLSENEVTSAVNRLNQPEKALQFNGESSYLMRNSALDLLENSDSFSVQFWAKAGPTSAMEPQCIFYEGFPGEFHFANADPGIDFTSYHWAAKDGGYNWYGPGYGIGTDWFHVVGVQDAGQLTLYINGQVIGSDFSASCCVNAPNDQMVVGARRVTSYIEHPFDGVIDDLGLWNRALTEEEVLALYLSEQPISGCTDTEACNYEPTATEDDGSCLAPISILNVGDTVVTTEPLILESSGTQCSWSTGAGTCSTLVTESGWYSVTQLESTSEGLRIDPGQQVSLGGEDDFNFGTGDFSVAIWFRSLDSITDYSSQLDPNGQFEILGKRPTSWTGNNNYYYDIQAGISQHASYGTTYQSAPGAKFHWNSEPHPGSFNAYTDQVVCDGFWHHLTAVKEGTTLKMAIDGSFVYSAQDRTPNSAQTADNDGPLYLGIADSAYAPMAYFIGQVQIFNESLTESELESLMVAPIDPLAPGLLGAWEFRGEEASPSDLSGGGNHAELAGASFAYGPASCESSDSVYVQFLVPGCTDLNACNFNDNAVVNDGSCIPSGCTDSYACNFDAESGCDDGSCDYSCCPGPGCCDVGMHWDWELGMCQITNVADTNLDGCVQLNDLLDVLSAYGNCGAEEVPWQCGNPLDYQGYEYETVQIGEQCWFAENSRILPSVSPASEHSLSQPISYVYGYNGNSVEEAKMTSNYSSYGVLYNFQATQQWDLCPSGWHVPSDEDWMELEYSLGLQQDSLSVVGYRGHLVGASMKSQDLWNGNNQSGLEMLAGGGTVDSGEFVFEGERGWYWTSTEAPAQAAWFRQLETSQSAVYRAHWNQNQESGHSVRCIQDSE